MLGLSLGTTGLEPPQLLMRSLVELVVTQAKLNGKYFVFLQVALWVHDSLTVKVVCVSFFLILKHCRGLNMLILIGFSWRLL